MAKGKKEQMTIIISHGRGPIDGAMFREAIEGHLGALYEISEMASKGVRKPTGWEIVSVSMNSPFHMTVRPKTVRGSALVGAYKRGLEKLKESSTRPKYFGDGALRHARQLAQAVHGGITSITIESKKYGRVNVSPDIIEHVNEIGPAEGLAIESPHTHSEWNTLRGRLYLVDPWGMEKSGVRFEIRDVTTRRKIRCVVRDEYYEQVHDAQLKRVAVYGRVKYNEQDEPTQIEAESIRILDDSSFDFDAKKKIDICEGVDSMTHVERVRNGT